MFPSRVPRVAAAWWSGPRRCSSGRRTAARLPCARSENIAGVDGQRELIGGRESGWIELVSHRSSWPELFEQERVRIAAALGPLARRIDHIGSTAVAGLDAKDIIDIDVSVEDPEEEGAYVAKLERAGYHLRVREPGHRMLRAPALDVHVHICACGSDWERRHLLFRDWLRIDAEDRERYLAVKRRLAGRVWADRNDYAEAKGEIIGEIMARAEHWARATGWSLQ